MTEPSATPVCVHRPSLHRPKGPRGGHSMGLGVREAGGRAEAGGLWNRKDAVLWDKLESKMGLARYEWEEENKRKMQFGKSRLE